jgi:hypothetical protein
MQYKILTIALLSSIMTVISGWSAIAAETVYKIRMRDATPGNVNPGVFASSGDLDREEWVILTVIDNKQAKIRHTTGIKNQTWFNRTWFDHPATAIRMCVTDGFDKRDCQTIKGDTIPLPQGRALHELSFDFQYTEGGAVYNRSVQVTPETKPQ